MQTACPPRLSPQSRLAALTGALARISGAKAVAVYTSSQARSGGIPLAICGEECGAPAPEQLQHSLALWDATGAPLTAQILGFDPAKMQLAHQETDGLLVLAVFPLSQPSESVTEAAEALALAAAESWNLQTLQAALETQRRLSMRHVENREAERKRMAEAIHSGPSQTLTTVRLSAASALRRLQEGDYERARHDLEELAAAAEEASASLIAILNGLGPAMIETLGPELAIRQECRLHQRSSGQEVICEFESPSADLRGRAALTAFRIVQHCLERAARHSGAGAVRIWLGKDSSGTRLAVDARGTGFNPAAEDDTLGLAAMREEASIVGAALRIEASPGSGGRVEICFPGSLTSC